MYRVLFQGRDAAHTPFVAREPETLIGRDSQCALRLADGGVSDRHAAIERRADGYYLRDLGSANGVRLNGQLVTEQRLATGDEIEIGSARLRFEIVHEPPPERRTVDALALTAGGVVTLIVVAQLALFAWIFSTPRPQRDTPIDTGKNPVQSPASAQPSAPAVDFPSVPPAPPPAAAVVHIPSVLNRMLKIQRIDRADGSDNVTLKIHVKAQVGERQLDGSVTAVCVQFFAGADAVPGKPVWLNAPLDWENFTTRVFTARFFGPPQQCAGYVVRTYYRKQLQDAVAAPPALLNAAPAPTL